MKKTSACSLGAPFFVVGALARPARTDNSATNLLDSGSKHQQRGSGGAWPREEARRRCQRRRKRGWHTRTQEQQEKEGAAMGEEKGGGRGQEQDRDEEGDID